MHTCCCWAWGLQRQTCRYPGSTEVLSVRFHQHRTSFLVMLAYNKINTLNIALRGGGCNLPERCKLSPIDPSSPSHEELTDSSIYIPVYKINDACSRFYPSTFCPTHLNFLKKGMARILGYISLSHNHRNTCTGSKLPLLSICKGIH